MSRTFFDTNILIYALGVDHKAAVARSLLDQGGCVSVQCLNEFASVALGKLRLSWPETEGLLVDLRRDCDPVVPLILDLHMSGLQISRRYRLSVYDGMIVAAALGAGCETLYSEDMHAGLVVDGRLTIVDPFA